MKKVIFVLLPLLLTGCLFSTPDSKFYLLETPQSTSAISNRRVNIAVQDITLPQYLDRPQIVLQRPDSPELKISEFNRWASDLNTMLQNFMIDDLQKNLPRAVIKRLAYGNNPRYIIKANIEKLGGWLGETAYLKGNWQILNSQGRVLYQQNINLSRPAGKSYTTYAAAQSQMWAEVSHSIAEKITQL